MLMQAAATVAGSDLETAGAIERAIHQRTSGRVRNLRVESRGELVVVHGATPTYYLKQLPLEAARKTIGMTRPFRIDIDVISDKG